MSIIDIGVGKMIKHNMQVVGLEPTCSCLRQILSLLRLPFRHTCYMLLGGTA